MKADCGLTVGPSGVRFDNEAVAGTGLTPEGDCGLAVDLDIGCGLVGGGASVAFNASAVAGGGLIASPTCTLNVGAGEGIEVTADEVKAKIGCGLKFVANAIEFDPDIVAGEGLAVGDAECQLDVNYGCGLTVDPITNELEVDNSDLAGTGLEASSESCALNVKLGCGLHAVAEGIEVSLDQIAGTGLEVYDPGLPDDCERIRVKPGTYPDFSNCAAWVWCEGDWDLMWCGDNGDCFTPPTGDGEEGEVKILCNCSPFTTTTTTTTTTSTTTTSTTTTSTTTTSTTTAAPTTTTSTTSTTTTGAPVSLVCCTSGSVNRTLHVTLTAVDTGCTPYANVNFDISYNATSQKWEGNFTVNACGTNLTQTFKFYCVVGNPQYASFDLITTDK